MTNFDKPAFDFVPYLRGRQNQYFQLSHINDADEVFHGLIWGWAFEDGSVVIKIFRKRREIREYESLPECLEDLGVTGSALSWSDKPWPIHEGIKPEPAGWGVMGSGFSRGKP